jgi:hypothetical protein
MDMMADEDSTGYIERTNSAIVLNSYENGLHDVILQGLEQSLKYGDGYDKEGTNENTKTNSRGVCFC